MLVLGPSPWVLTEDDPARVVDMALTQLKALQGLPQVANHRISRNCLGRKRGTQHGAAKVCVEDVVEEVVVQRRPEQLCICAACCAAAAAREVHAKQVHCSATPSFAYMLTRFHKDEVEENGGTLEVLNVRHSRCFAPSAGVSLMMYHVRLHGRAAHIVFPHRGPDLCKVTVSQHFRLV